MYACMYMIAFDIKYRLRLEKAVVINEPTSVNEQCIVVSEPKIPTSVCYPWIDTTIHC